VTRPAARCGAITSVALVGHPGAQASRGPRKAYTGSMTAKERLHEILLGLTDPEAQIVWDIHSSRPPDEDLGEALGRGLAEVYRQRPRREL
jgi:hypothetical protein